MMTVQFSAELLTDMCNNLTVYEHFFTVSPGSQFMISDMQEAMCSLNVNITQLIQEAVGGIEGVAELITLVSEKHPTPPQRAHYKHLTCVMR